MKNYDWKPAQDPLGYGDDRVIGIYNVQDDDGLGGGTERAPFRMDGSGPNNVPGLAPDRLEEIRRRMEDGTYVSEAMAEQVARRLIARGDF